MHEEHVECVQIICNEVTECPKHSENINNEIQRCKMSPAPEPLSNLCYLGPLDDEFYQSAELS